MTAKKSKRYVNQAKTKSANRPSGIKLGNLVKDLITGFTGIATSRTEHLFGCVHIGITSCDLDKDGVPLGAFCTDEQRVVVVDKRDPEISPDSKAASGEPVPDAVLRHG